MANTTVYYDRIRHAAGIQNRMPRLVSLGSVQMDAACDAALSIHEYNAIARECERVAREPMRQHRSSVRAIR